MQHLEGSGTPVLYIGCRFLKVNYVACNASCRRKIFIYLLSNNWFATCMDDVSKLAVQVV
jgi:hypothetical protein